DRISRRRDSYPDPLVSDTTWRDPHLQIIVGHDQRAIFKGQTAAHRAELRLAERPRQSLTDVTRDAGPLPHARSRHFAAHRRRRAAGPIRVRTDVHVWQRRT